MASTGKALVCNTASRCAELCEELRKVTEDGRLLNKQAQRLRGRVQFAESQLFGRTGKRCLRVLANFSAGRKSLLAEKDNIFLRMFHDLLVRNVPREVGALSSENVVVFTDACYEKDHPTWPCGLGGAEFASGKTYILIYFFSLAVDEELRTLLGEKDKKPIIFEVETLAALLARNLWQPLFGSKRVILFVDNEGTKFSLLKGVSDNACVDAMAEAFAKLECQLHAMVWIARVPSKSNIADPPSRGITDVPLLVCAEKVSVPAKSHLLENIPQIAKMGETAARQSKTCSLAAVFESGSANKQK